MTKISAGATTAYDHDPNGNLTRAGATSYAYDSAGRMASVVTGPDHTTYGYSGDSLRERATRTAAAVVVDDTEFDWDQNFSLPEMIAESDATTGVAERTYLFGLGLVATGSGTSAGYFHKDSLGSVLHLTDATGGTDWNYSYEPFGKSRQALKADPLAPDNPMRFTGQYLDPTGMYHLRARQYDPELGRFGAPDPLDSRLTRGYASVYRYALNQPTQMIDPSGLATCTNQDNGDIWYDLGDSFAAFGDWVTFGITDDIRDELGVNDCVSKESIAHTAFTDTTCGEGAFADTVRSASLFDDPSKPIIANAATGALRWGNEVELAMTRALEGARNFAKAPFRVSLFVTGVGSFAGLACKRY
ncbi:MAG: RHS repeat-associated core domain-containing protein [Acidimicrobiia bacterium]